MTGNKGSLSPQQIYTQAVAVLTFLVGQLVAFVPTMAPAQEKLISGGSTVIAAGLAIGGAIHHLATSKSHLTASQVVSKVETSVEDRLRQQITNAGMVPRA